MWLFTHRWSISLESQDPVLACRMNEQDLFLAPLSPLSSTYAIAFAECCF
jgi:hypothetical protein